MHLGQWVGLIAIVVSLYILWKIRQVLLLAFLAVALATVLNRFVQRLERQGVKRGIGVAIAFLMVLTFFVLFIGLIVPPFFDQLPFLIDQVPKGLDQLRLWFEWVQNRIPGQSLDNTRIITRLTQEIPLVINRLFGSFYTIFTNSIEIIFSSLLVLAVTIMLLANPQSYRNGFLLLFPSFYRMRGDEILSKCEQALVGWLIGILFNMTVITVFSAVGLLILGVPLPLTNALLAGLLTFIPNLGPTLSVIPPAALALLEAPWRAIAVVVLYIVIQQVESNILTPMVMRHQVSLLPAVTLLSQVAFAVFFGFLGLVLALPLVVVGQVWLQELLINDILTPWRTAHRQEKPKDEQPL